MKRNKLLGFLLITLGLNVFTTWTLAGEVEPSRAAEYEKVTGEIIDKAFALNALEVEDRFKGTQEVPGFCQLIDQHTLIDPIARKLAKQITSGASDSEIELFKRIGKTKLAATLLLGFSNFTSERESLEIKTKFITPATNDSIEFGSVSVKSQKGDVNLVISLAVVGDNPPKLYEATTVGGAFGGIGIVKQLKLEYRGTAIGVPANDAIRRSKAEVKAGTRTAPLTRLQFVIEMAEKRLKKAFGDFCD